MMIFILIIKEFYNILCDFRNNVGPPLVIPVPREPKGMQVFIFINAVCP